MTTPKLQLSSIPTTLDFAIDIDSCKLFELLDDGEKKALTKARRKELLREVRQGEPHELLIEALVYQQSDTPRPLPASRAKEANLNFYYFTPGTLPGLAKSYRGRNFLCDHSRKQSDVGGRVVASELRGVGGWMQLRQSLRLISKWAVEAALEGTMSTFSIGWEPKQRGFTAMRESLFCTVCSKRMLTSDCPHFPGDVVQLDESGNRAIVELEWRSAIGVETSAVSFPAVPGTEIESVRAALAVSRAEFIKEPDDMTDEQKAALAKRAKALGLPEGATIEQVLQAGEAASAQHATELAAAELARDSALTSLDAAKVEAVARTAAMITELRADAYSTGLMAINDDRDKLFCELAADDIEKGKRFLATLRPITPVGQGNQSDDDPTAIVTAAPVKKLEKILVEECDLDSRAAAIQAPMLKSALKQLGLTPEEFAKHGQHTLGREEN